MPSKKVQELLHVIRKAGLTRSELRELEEMVFQLQLQEVQYGVGLKEFPPKVPTHPEKLNRAVCLLGNRLSADLKDKARAELIRLIGVYPTLEQAGLWKHTLRQRMKDMTAPIP